MNFEILTFGIFIGGLMAIIFVGIGVIIEYVRHYFSDKGTTETRQFRDNGADTVFCKRHCDRSGNNGCDKELNHDIR